MAYFITANNKNYNTREYTAQMGAIITRAQAEGFTIPNRIILNSIEFFISGLIELGVWDKLDVLFQFNYNDPSLSNFSRINWKRPFGPLATINGGCTYTTQGWIGNETDGFIDTLYNPTTDSQNYTLNNAGRAVVIYNRSGINNNAVDQNGSTNNIRLIQSNQRINGAAFNIATTPIVGLVGINRTSSSDVNMIFNNTTESYTGVTSSSVGNATFKLFVVNSSYSPTGIGNYIISSSLSFTETQAYKRLYNSFIEKFNGIIVYENEVNTLLDRATTLGYSLPSYSTKNQINDQIIQLKASGVWNKMDIYYNFAYKDSNLSDFSRLNWKNPSSNQITTSGANIYTDMGWEGNGVDSYLITNFTPSTQAVVMQLNNASRGAVSYKNSVTLGNHIDGNGQGIQLRQLSTVQQRINAAGNYTGGTGNFNLAGDGLKVICRDDNNVGRLYNKSLEGTVTLPTATTLGVGPQWLFRSGNSYGDTGVSNYFIGASLSANDISQLRGIYNNYLSKIGLTQYA